MYMVELPIEIRSVEMGLQYVTCCSFLFIPFSIPFHTPNRNVDIRFGTQVLCSIPVFSYIIFF